jgi:hypothetical protein
MDIDQKIAVLVQTVSHQGGRIDALAGALACVLQLARATPGLRSSIETQLEQRYARLLAQSENPDYVAGFESVRDAILAGLAEDKPG